MSDGVMIMVATTYKINPTALITEKQFNWLRDLAKTRDLSQASEDVRATVMTVTQHTGNWIDCEVLRVSASQAITFLTGAPKIASAPAATAQAVNLHTPLTPVERAQLATALGTSPLSKYAIPVIDQVGIFSFYEIVERKTSVRYVNMLRGAPGDWRRVFIPAHIQLIVARRIAKDPTKYALLYCQTFTRCSACDSPLSNAVSIAEAMGPVCRKKFTW